MKIESTWRLIGASRGKLTVYTFKKHKCYLEYSKTDFMDLSQHSLNSQNKIYHSLFEELAAQKLINTHISQTDTALMKLIDQLTYAILYSEK